MKKDEILKRAQSERFDEMEYDIYQKGGSLSLKAGVVVCLLLMAVKVYKGMQWNDLYIVLGSMCFVHYAYIYNRKKTKSDLFFSIIWLCVSIFNAVLFFKNILGL